MLNKDIKKYIGLTIFAVIIIAIYKSWNTEFIGTFLGLLTPLFTGIVLAYLLYFPSKKIENLLNKIPFKPIQKISRLSSIIVVYTLLFAIFYAVLRLFVPPLLANLYDIVSQTPSFLDKLITYLETHNFMGYSLNRDALFSSISSSIFRLYIVSIS